MDAEEALARAGEALERGRWEEARAGFEAVLAQGESPDALLGLADALFWQGDAHGCIACMERAYAALRRAGQPGGAVTIAIWLAILYKKCLGNQTACSGWVARAARLIEDHQQVDLEGWLWWARAFEATDIARTLDAAERALAHARKTPDADLELCSLGELGSALVAAGRVEEGLALCDEAMAATLAGEFASRDTVVAATCCMLEACDCAADLVRVRDWCRVADDFMRTFGGPFLFADCRTRYGRVLFTTGDWEGAERELTAAARVTPADTDYHARAVASLAELRLRQGRLEEAEALLSPLVDAPVAGASVAAVRHARGEHALSVAILERCVGALDAGDPDTVVALALLVDVHLARGDLEAARRAADAIAAPASGRRSARAEAQSAFALGRVAAASGKREAAARLLGQAVGLLARGDTPYETARARLALARVRAGEAPEEAVAEAQSALATFERLGAAPDAGAAAALLRSLGAAARTGPKNLGLLTQREREVLRLLGAGLSNPQIAERLVISRKTASYHVSNVLAKLGLRNRAEAAAYATRMLSDAASGGR